MSVGGGKSFSFALIDFFDKFFDVICFIKAIIVEGVAVSDQASFLVPITDCQGADAKDFGYFIYRKVLLWHEKELE